MVSVSASMRGERLVAEALRRYAAVSSKAAAAAPKVMAYAICDGLRKRTKKAPKFMRRAEWNATPIKPPRKAPYITRGGQLIHRYDFSRHVGTDNEKKYPIGVYSAKRQNRRGETVTDTAAEMREIRQTRTKVRNAGLAKRSWGWAKKDIFGRGDDPVYEMRKGDRRNPTDAVRASAREGGGVSRAEIHNALDYIIAAVPGERVTEVCEAAAKRIVFKAARRAHMTLDEAKAEAEAFAAAMAATPAPV